MNPKLSVKKKSKPALVMPIAKNPLFTCEKQVNSSRTEIKEKSEVVILVCGAVNGQYERLFSKVEKYLQKTPCEYLFCTGEFFGSNYDDFKALVDGKIKVPIPTYFLGATNSQYDTSHESVKSVPNLHYLGKKGCLHLTSGLKIAYLSGKEQSMQPSSPTIVFSEEDVNELIKSLESETVDILLTSPWPAGVTKNMPQQDKEFEKREAIRCMSPLIARLAKALKPRYHFCGLMDYLYERVPYRNHIEGQEMPVNVTRFYGLPFVSGKKSKFVLAFNLKPASKMNSKELNDPSGPTTACPYSASETQYFFDTVHSSSSSGTTRTRRNANDGPQPWKKQVLDVTDCWFCLANKKADKHLIIEVGKLSYLALCKGPLVREHILIIPISHISSATKLPSDIEEEMTQFKLSLVAYFNRTLNMDTVIFERNYKSPHMCFQVIPFPKSKHLDFIAEIEHFSLFYSVPFFKLPEFDFLNEQFSPDEPYFYFEIYVENYRFGRFAYRLKEKLLPLHFGRIFLASEKLLNKKDRIDWKDCEDTKKEVKIVQEFKEDFQAYKKMR